MKVISASVSKNNAMSKFIVTRQTCMSCKTVIKSGAVCKNCKHKIRELYIEKRLEVNYYERLFNGNYIWLIYG